MKKMKKCMKNGGYTAEGFTYNRPLSNLGMPIVQNGGPLANLPMSNLGTPLIPGGQWNAPQSQGNNSSQNGYYEQGGPIPYLLNSPMSNVGTPLIPMPRMQDGGRKAPAGSHLAPNQGSVLYNTVTYPGDTLTDNQLRPVRNNMVGNSAYIPDQGTEQYRPLSIYNPSPKDLAKMKKLGYNLSDIASMGDYRMDNVPAPNTYVDTNAFNPNQYKEGGWIQGAVNPAHKGYCSPMTKSTCTPRRKAFAMTMKKHHGFHKEYGGPMKYVTGGYTPTYLDDPNQEQEVPNTMGPQPDTAYQAPPTGLMQQEMSNTPMPGTAQENAPWRAGMDDAQAQQNIQDGSIPDNGMNAGRSQRQRPFGTGFNNLLGAGMVAASFYENQRDQRNMQGYNRQAGMTDNVFAGQKMQPGSRGDYTANHGYFRPTQNTPTKAGMFYPQQYGGPQRMDVGGGLLPVAYTPSAPLPDNNTAMSPMGIPQAPVQQNIQKFSGKGRKGDIATDTNNPGNMKYSEWMANYQGQPSGIPGTDGGEFAAFPDVDHGLQAYKQQLFGDVDGTFKSRYYKADTTVDKALKTWSNGAYGADIYPALKGKKLGELSMKERDELVKRQIKRESPSMFQQLHAQGYYKMGGEYHMSDKDIRAAKAAGYQFDIID